MYVYLSKKISLPNNSKITACAWNRSQGYVAVGSNEGLVKVIKLEMGEGKEHKSKGLSNSLLMNASLNAHSGEVSCIAWNHVYTKMTTADSNGKIVVWTISDGEWHEEMVNKRDGNVVTGMKWSSDGLHICITYSDGVIILGSLEGHRIWVKELKNTVLHIVEWSPDKRLLLFGLANGEIHLYDFNGNFMEKLKPRCLDSLGVTIAAIDWYDGQNGFLTPDSPALALCYTNGRCQIMANESDEHPVIMDCQMDIVCAQWNHDGSVLAIGGVQPGQDQKDEINIIQFFNPWGLHLKTLKLPTSRLKACAWEGNSLRMVIAVDSYVFFANMRPSYKWCYFNNTIAYSFTKPTKLDQCVMFYDTRTGDSFLKYVKRMIGIAGGGDYCVIISQAEDTNSGATFIGNSVAINASLALTKTALTQFAIVLYNSIGTPLEARYIDVQPIHWCMSASHIVVASKSYFYIWNYRMMVDHNSLKRQSTERLIFIDNPTGSMQVRVDETAIISIGANMQETANPISCVACSDKFLFVGRESGMIQKFSIASGNLAEVVVNESVGIIPAKISVNSNSTKMAVIDKNSMLKLFDLTSKQQKEEYLNFRRNDVWNVVWSEDNPDQFVSMEKIKMHIFKDIQGEEPIPCSGYVCSFSDLQVKVALLDDIMQRPDNPALTDIQNYDTKALRDTRELIEKLTLQDATQYIEQNSHPILWRLLAENALNKLDIKTAEHAFVKCKDYYGIEFTKKLQNLNNQQLKKAEIAAYFKKFDEAESIYLEADRKDLAYQLRKKLGDWFKVLQLLKAGTTTKKSSKKDQDMYDSDMLSSLASTGSDMQLEEAYNEIGEYHMERQDYAKAVKFFILGRNLAKQADCYYIMEDYDSLVKVLDQLPDNNELLPRLAEMFESVGMCSQASEAYLKCQNVKAAVDTCVKLNQWDEGIRLAKQHNITSVDILLAKQATSFLDQNKIFNAIELYRKARHYLDAARLMFQVTDKEAKQQSSPLLIKKMYVLGGLLVESYRDLVKAGGILSNKIKVAQKDQASKALDGILSEESQVALTDSKILDNAWRGAEAYHFLMLCQRQLRAGTIEAAFKTSMALMDYDDILNPKHIYSLIALCACGNGSYNMASRAFVKLESSDSIDPKERKDFEALAFQIFSLNSPKDKKPALKGNCPQCGLAITEWCTNCPHCDTKFAPCIVSGRPILEPQFWVCGSCKHRAIEQEISNRISCPLCHMPVR